MQNSKKNSAKYFLNHPDRHGVSMIKYGQRKRLAAIELLGGVCQRCGFSDVRALQVDHINGGGNKETKHYSGAAHMARVIKRTENKEATGRPKNKKL